MEISLIGQSALLNVTEECRPGRESVTTLLLNTVVLTVKETAKRPESATLTIVQLTVCTEISQDGPSVQRSAREADRREQGNVTTPPQRTVVKTVKDGARKPGFATLSLVQLTGCLESLETGRSALLNVTEVNRP